MKQEFDLNSFYRSRHEKIITGLAGGLARHFEFDVFYVRVAMVIGMFIAPMFCGMAYLIASMLLKER
ncbi:PspC domain-containing protein [Alteromonas flava]|uniref:PspC domain-containing protein n=1 Tax=Alteromonas flava TaxID=2048003 RepID=UPI000C282F7C|nr:PspC domain-containing protein [Alteromonas flava]